MGACVFCCFADLRFGVLILVFGLIFAYRLLVLILVYCNVFACAVVVCFDFAYFVFPGRGSVFAVWFCGFRVAGLCILVSFDCLVF